MGSPLTTPGGRFRPAACTAAVVAVALWCVLGPAPGAAQTELPLTTDLVVVEPTGITVPRTGGSGLLRAVVRSDGDVAGPASSVQLLLPDGVALDPTVPGADPGCSAAGPVVTCDLGTIPPGSSHPLAVGVRTGAFGAPADLAAVVRAPTSARWDRSAGELEFRSWDVEAGGQGVSLQQCWPVTNPAPNMDLTGGGPDGQAPCDGTNDEAAARPDVDEIVPAFPPAFSEPVTRSWEWQTRITPAWSGTYLVCTAGIDDGGYVTVSPAGSAPTAADVVVDVPSYTPGLVEGRVDLEAGRGYDVVIRISNRGGPGIDDGGAGPGGWGYVGVAPAVGSCSPEAATALSVDAPGFTPAVPIPISVLGVASVRITGTVTSGDRRWSSARAINDGPDATIILATATGGTETLDGVLVRPGGTAVWTTGLDPAAVPPQTVPWTVRPFGTLPP